MKILGCECSFRTATLGSDLNGKGDEYRDAKYKVLSSKAGITIIKVFSSLAGGIRYASGSAETNDGNIYLNCETIESDTIEFELLAWEATFTISTDGDASLGTIYFQNEIINNIV